MKIIPVIDLKNGQVVHAQQGQRDRYQAINTKLCPSPEFIDVIHAFLSLYAFDTFYIADLNAITGQDSHARLLTDVLGQFPEINFWVDAGFQGAGNVSTYPRNYVPVLGSESYRDDNLAELKAFQNRFILSLDYLGQEPLGSATLFADPSLWPEQTIIMTLAQVGSGNGPDMQKLTAFCKNYPQKNFIAAGGIRDIQDLTSLQALGIKQVLVASALHSGQISQQDIANLQAKKYPEQRGIF